MRLFLALELPERAGERFFESVERIRSAAVRGTFTRRENVHLTLAFLGEQPEDRVPDIREVMDGCAPGPITLKVGHLERFRNRDGVTLVRTVEKDPGLISLQSELSDSLRALGFVLDDRPYLPHLTVGRKVVLRPGATLEDLDRETEPLTARIGKMTLFLSHRTDGVLIYTPLHTLYLPFG